MARLIQNTRDKGANVPTAGRHLPGLRGNPAFWSRSNAVARQRFLCLDCGLNFPWRRAAHPERLPPYRCICCDFLTTIDDPVAREALRRVLARNQVQRRFGGRDATPAS